jgi:anti-sigma factor RsiW
MTGPWNWLPWRRRAAASPSGLSCRELVELVTDYLEGALPHGERARFDAHIAGCPHCTAYLEQMRDTIRIMGTLEPESLPGDMERELLLVFRTWKTDGAT